MSRFWICLLLLLTVVNIAFSADKQTYKPSETPVALLPVVSMTGEKWERLRTEQADCAYNEMKCLFQERGFALVESYRITNAISELGIDFKDEEQLKKENLYKIGDSVKSKLIALVVITDSAQRQKRNTFFNQNEGYVRIKVWLLDVADKTAILSGKSFEAKRVPGLFSGIDKGSELQVDAARRAVQNAFKDFLNPYKMDSKLKREDISQPTYPDIVKSTDNNIAK